MLETHWCKVVRESGREGGYRMNEFLWLCHVEEYWATCQTTHKPKLYLCLPPREKSEKVLRLPTGIVICVIVILLFEILDGAVQRCIVL